MPHITCINGHHSGSRHTSLLQTFLPRHVSSLCRHLGSSKHVQCVNESRSPWIQKASCGQQYVHWSQKTHHQFCLVCLEKTERRKFWTLPWMFWLSHTVDTYSKPSQHDQYQKKGLRQMLWYAETPYPSAVLLHGYVKCQSYSSTFMPALAHSTAYTGLSSISTFAPRSLHQHVQDSKPNCGGLKCNRILYI